MNDKKVNSREKIKTFLERDLVGLKKSLQNLSQESLDNLNKLIEKEGSYFNFSEEYRKEFTTLNFLVGEELERRKELKDKGITYTPVETKNFAPINSEELIKILGLTIKKDEENKATTFLCELSAYTESSPFNISFNAPSASGKSYIPIEIARLFPKEDVLEIGYSSPTAFFHDIGTFDKEKGGYVINLGRKILIFLDLIFLDQPHTLLLQHLRPILSHDKKEIQLKITDKSQKAGLRTKNIFIRGFPAVIFCTASLKVDEQESTRFILLSPETSQEKLREGIIEKIKRESDRETYLTQLNENPERKLLKQRLLAIRQEGITDVKINFPDKVQKVFFDKHKILKPRHQRDIGRLICLIKALSLLNLWFREREDSVLIANETDLREALKIWDKISESQEFNLPPYIYNLYKEIIAPAYYERNSEGSGGVSLGLSRQEITQKHLQVYGRHLEDWRLRQEILPMLESSGLIYQEADPVDKRQKLVYPTTALTTSSDENYSEKHGGVDKEQTSDDLAEESVNTFTTPITSEEDDSQPKLILDPLPPEAKLREKEKTNES